MEEERSQKLISIVYAAKTFKDENLFKRLENAGYNVEDILFEDADSNIVEMRNVPRSVLKIIRNNLDLCLFTNRGRGAGDGMLEDPSSGRILLMYNRRKLHPFMPNELKEYRHKLEDTSTYYAKNSKELEEALIGVIRFV
jgi:hypothetical protein